jgi:hypothetical protein
MDMSLDANQIEIVKVITSASFVFSGIFFAIVGFLLPLSRTDPNPDAQAHYRKLAKYLIGVLVWVMICGIIGFLTLWLRECCLYVAAVVLFLGAFAGLGIAICLLLREFHS